MISSTLVILITNFITERRGNWAKKRLNSKLDEAMAEVKELSLKLQKIEDDEQNEIIEEAKKKGKDVRIWMDGAFDMMHYGHMNAFRQGAALGTYLIVGVNSDASITVNKGQPVCNDDERLQCVAGCKFVNEVVTDVPYVMSPEYVKHIIEKYDIDYIVHGDDECLTPDGKDVYAAAKAMDKYRSIPRTEGVSTTDIVGRMLLNTKTHHNNKESDNIMYDTNPNDSSPDKNLGRVRAESWHKADDGADSDDDLSVLSIANDNTAADALHNILTNRRSNFLTTSHILRQFSMGVQPPKKTDRVVYIAGDWDMFHAGHILAIANAKKMGDYLIVGIHADSIVNARYGYNLPIMNLQERVLSVLGCKNVDDVLIDAPYTITGDMISSLKISTVVKSSVDLLSSDNGSGSLDHNTSELDLAMKNSSNTGLNKFGSEDDPYGVPREMGILKDTSNIPSKFRKLTVLDIVDRIKEQRERFEKKFAKKKKAEDEYYKQRYNKK
jgi:ethanolamine-phosphate cytidylyltransferase